MPASFLLPAQGLDLAPTLSSGQTFGWRYQAPEDRWLGWIGDSFVSLKQKKNGIEVQSDSVTPARIRQYFSLDLDWISIHSELSSDPHLRRAILDFPGLRIVRDPWWECTANFICSSLKQIVQIQQINQSLRARFGPASASAAFPAFPAPSLLAAAAEADIRLCKLGYRATHLHRSAALIEAGQFHFAKLEGLSTDEASAELQSLRGVGEKVARCILLYAGSRHDAFPIDVWVERLMADLYWKKRRKPRHDDFDRLSFDLFGPKRGLAQLILFHWYRTGENRTPPRI